MLAPQLLQVLESVSKGMALWFFDNDAGEEVGGGIGTTTTTTTTTTLMTYRL